MIKVIRDKLFSPIEIYSLVFIRISFGLIMFWNSCKYFYKDRINAYYINTEFHFKYFGFEWVNILPDYLMQPLFVILSILALMISLGIFYRTSSTLFLIIFTYIFLLDQSLYLNHYYMIIIFNFLLCLMPANRYFSIDSNYINPSIKTKIIPAWPIFLLAIQMEIILIYAGIVKINLDWLQLYPLKFLLPKYEYFFGQIWFVILASYGSILLHILGAPLLIFKSTRLYVFLVYTCFHSINYYLFHNDIGIFPWITLALTTVFFNANWPVQFWNFVIRIKESKFRSLKQLIKIFQERGYLRINNAKLKPIKISRGKQNIIIIFIIIWSLFQIVFPLRRLLYEGNSAWTYQGNRFSWQMKLHNMDGYVSFYVKDNKSGQYLENNETGEMHHLTHIQRLGILCKPDMILQYAHYLHKIWSQKLNHKDISVYVGAFCSLNGRKPYLIIDPSVDLVKEKDGIFFNNKWIVPMNKNLKPGFLYE